jgi:hypothetical protein
VPGYKDPPKDRRFKPGEVHNPKGYSRGRRLTARLLALFKSKDADGAFLNVGLKEALKGDFRFWSYIYDRIDGKPTSRTDEAMVRIAAKNADADKAEGTLASMVGDAEKRARKRKRNRKVDPPAGGVS